MKVRCIKDYYEEDEYGDERRAITEGHIYEVLKKKTHTYLIEDDNGYDIWIDKDVFEPCIVNYPKAVV